MNSNYNVINFAHILAAHFGHYWINGAYNMLEAGIQMPDPRMELEEWVPEFHRKLKFANNILGLNGQFDWGVMPQLDTYGSKLTHTTGSGRLTWNISRGYKDSVKIEFYINRPDNVGSIRLDISIDTSGEVCFWNRYVEGEVFDRHYDALRDAMTPVIATVHPHLAMFALDVKGILNNSPEHDLLFIEGWHAGNSDYEYDDNGEPLSIKPFFVTKNGLITKTRVRKINEDLVEGVNEHIY